MSDGAKSTGWCLVTGGARRLGAAIVRTLHGRGLNVFIHCHGSRAEADALASELLAQRPGSVQVLQADLAAPGAAEAMAADLLARGLSLRLLVNNASRFYATPLGTVTGEAWKDLMGSNVRGAFFLSQALLPLLRGGAIVNLLDIHARRPMPAYPGYSMAKAALEMMTKSLALELAPDIRVNGVAPGAILWPEGDSSEAGQAQVLARIPMARTGQAEDIASSVCFLGLDAHYVTGQVLAVDGGRSLNI